MSKTIVTVVGILTTASAIIIGLYILASHNRYYITAGDKGIAYEVDRKTGESWILFSDGKESHQVNLEDRRKEELFPTEVSSMITGNAQINSSSKWLEGELYNGSDWVVTRVIINVSVVQKNDGTVLKSRDFSEALTIKPLTVKSFSIKVLGKEGTKDVPDYVHANAKDKEKPIVNGTQQEKDKPLFKGTPVDQTKNKLDLIPLPPWEEKLWTIKEVFGYKE